MIVLLVQLSPDSLQCANHSLCNLILIKYCNLSEVIQDSPVHLEQTCDFTYCSPQCYVHLSEITRESIYGNFSFK